MNKQLPIEKNYGAMLLIKDCWSRDEPKQWLRAIEQLHGASMVVCDDLLFHEFLFLIEISDIRLEMAEEVEYEQRSR